MITTSIYHGEIGARRGQGIREGDGPVEFRIWHLIIPINYLPTDYAGIVVLALPDDATTAQVEKLLEIFVERKDWLAHLIGRLAIVELWRVRFRPA